MARPGSKPAELTRDAKAMIQLAFEDLGGLQRLVEWANQPQNLSLFYTQIWKAIVPKDIKQEHAGADGGPVKMSISWMTGIEEAAIADKEDCNSISSETASSNASPGISEA